MFKIYSSSVLECLGAHVLYGLHLYTLCVFLFCFDFNYSFLICSTLWRKFSGEIRNCDFYCPVLGTWLSEGALGIVWAAWLHYGSPPIDTNSVKIRISFYQECFLHSLLLFSTTFPITGFSGPAAFWTSFKYFTKLLRINYMHTPLQITLFYVQNHTFANDTLCRMEPAI